MFSPYLFLCYFPSASLSLAFRLPALTPSNLEKTIFTLMCTCVAVSTCCVHSTFWMCGECTSTRHLCRVSLPACLDETALCTCVCRICLWTCTLKHWITGLYYIYTVQYSVCSSVVVRPPHGNHLSSFCIVCILQSTILRVVATRTRTIRSVWQFTGWMIRRMESMNSAQSENWKFRMSRDSFLLMGLIGGIGNEMKEWRVFWSAVSARPRYVNI